MDFREAYNALKAALVADAWIVANSVPVIDGIHANMAIDDLAREYATTFSENNFTIVIEHPGAATLEDAERIGFLVSNFAIIMVENPAYRSGVSPIDPLAAVFEVASAAFGKPVESGGRNVFKLAQKFYSYAGEARSHLYHRFNYTIGIQLPAKTLSATRAQPQAV